MRSASTRRSYFDAISPHRSIYTDAHLVRSRAGDLAVEDDAGRTRGNADRRAATAGDLGVDLARRLLLAGLAIVEYGARSATPAARTQRACERSVGRFGASGAGWLLLEHPGPWRIDAIAGAGIEFDVLSTANAGSVTRTVGSPAWPTSIGTTSMDSDWP